MTTLSDLNACDPLIFAATLRGIYEHSPWIPAAAAAMRPFNSLAALKLGRPPSISAAKSSNWRSCVRTRNWQARLRLPAR
jgi:N-carbamoyl-L-amino-acid hydrolase